MQLPEFQPTPTRCPILTPLAFGPSRDSTDDLVTKNRGVMRDAPLVVQDRKIGVTQTAMFDSDFNVFRRERSQIDHFESHRLLWRARNPRLTLRVGN